MVVRVLARLWRVQRADGTSTHAIWMAIGAVISLAVLATVGHAVYAYFQHFGNCLNGC